MRRLFPLAFVFALFAQTGCAQAQAVIALNPSTTYQTMTGWMVDSPAMEAVDVDVNALNPDLPNYINTVIDGAVNTIGFNMIGVAMHCGWENPTPYWKGQLIDKTIPRTGPTGSKANRRTTINSNRDPDHILVGGVDIQFDELDYKIDKVINPMRAAMAARGETLWVMGQYEAFTGTDKSSDWYTHYFHNDSDMYARFVLSIYLHMQSKYGWTPDSWEVMIEPDFDNLFYLPGQAPISGGVILGNHIVKTAAKLREYGFTPRFVVPSVNAASNLQTYWRQITSVPGAEQYVYQVSYHRYDGPSNATLTGIGGLTNSARGAMMTEWEVTSPETSLYKDLTLAQNTGWSQGPAFVATSITPYAAYQIDYGPEPPYPGANYPTNSGVRISYQSKLLRQYFQFVRRGAVRIGASSSSGIFAPTAFINTNGKYAVVVEASAAGNFTVGPLPAGAYGIRYAKTDGFADEVNLTDQIVGAGGSVSVSVPAAAWVTVYAKDLPTRAFAIVNLGGVSASAAGSVSVPAGYARVQPDPGFSTPAGLEIFGSRRNNILVSETGVPASPLITSGRIYAETNGPVKTGLAIANPNRQAANVSFVFTDVNGVNSATRTISMPAGGQLARFLDEDPYLGSKSFQGAFSFTSDAPISAIALRAFTNERDDFLMSTLPVIETGSGQTGVQTLPFFATGNGWTTQVILVNSGVAPLTGTVQFLGGDGLPISVTVDNQVTNSAAYFVAAGSSRKLLVSGVVAVGSIRVVPTASAAAPAALAVFSFKPGPFTVTEAGASANAGSAFRMYVESAGIHGQSGNIQSGVAVTNNTSAAVDVSCELFTMDGAPAVAPVVMTLAANGQSAKFLDEIFPTLAPPFRGVLRVSSVASIAVVGLRGRYNARTPDPDFIITTTPPVLESAAATSAEQIFPELVNGGGVTTEFILFSGAAGQVSAGNLSFFTDTGAPLSLNFN